MNTRPVPKKLFGIIGHPLGHTLSPLIHNSAFEILGLDYVYMAWPLAPGLVGRFVDSVRLLPISGVSVTIPHKRSVMKHLDCISESAKALGAVNTLYWDQNELMGENTDVTGFMDPLRDLDPKDLEPALVLGAGGAARAAVAGLKYLRVKKVYVTNRTHARAWAISQDLDCQPLDWQDRSSLGARLIVNATPLGMQGENQNLSPWPENAFTPENLAYDLVYTPKQTKFLAQAQAAGAQTIEGLTMLLGQAKEQFRLWTNQQFPMEQIRPLLENALAKKE